MTSPWWQRDDLTYKNGHLHFAGQNLQTLARHGTPTFLYSPARVRANLER